jgi:hypothetical protein
MKRDIDSGKAGEPFQKDKEEMNVSFLTLVYMNRLTGKKAQVSNVFTSDKHEEAIEKISDGKLTKKIPIDILEYMEQHKEDTVFSKEISEVFAISQSEVENRMKILASGGLFKTKTFDFGGTAWILAQVESYYRAGQSIPHIRDIASSFWHQLR